MPRQRRGHQSKALYELSTVVLNLIRSAPTPVSFSGEESLIAPPASEAAPSSSRRRPPAPQITPAGFASLLLGVSMSLMLCGSVTFFIGFILMPWVFGLVMMLYLAGTVSALSVLGRSIFGSAAAAPPDPPKKIA
ncbi:uncharacterized protein LOC116200577 [Punica granatum]|uniref:Uncharacterized protein LOC116200577 n=1 Tax=Punica granatum TaxID=22663 RepID=A0A6P8D0U6_PUNGR|nr:uncharacterized protein LOC116200577 [Punica granatum]